MENEGFHPKIKYQLDGRPDAKKIGAKLSKMKISFDLPRISSQMHLAPVLGPKIPKMRKSEKKCGKKHVCPPDVSWTYFLMTSMFGLGPNDMSGVHGCLSDPNFPFLAFPGRFSVNLTVINRDICPERQVGQNRKGRKKNFCFLLEIIF